VTRLVSALAVLCAAASLGACGNKKDFVTEAETEGIYLTVGQLKYQVQISRQLEPSSPEDRTYLLGLKSEDRALAPNEVWFALFIRVENDRDHGVYQAARDFEIRDTVDNVYRPLTLVNNPFAYRPKRLAPKGLIPVVDSVAAESTIQGSLLLFKVPNASLENRPLELIIKSPGPPPHEGSVNLDV
jgi:hypothetical protein